MTGNYTRWYIRCLTAVFGRNRSGMDKTADFSLKVCCVRLYVVGKVKLVPQKKHEDLLLKLHKILRSVCKSGMTKQMNLHLNHITDDDQLDICPIGEDDLVSVVGCQ